MEKYWEQRAVLEERNLMQLASIKYFSLHQEQWLIACTSILMLTADTLLVQTECNSWDRLTENTK